MNLVRCRDCGEVVDRDDFSQCIQCDRALPKESPRRTVQYSAAQLEARGDAKGSQLALGILGGIGGIMALAMFLTAGGEFLPVLVIAALVLVVVVGVVTALRGGDSSAIAKNVGWMAMGAVKAVGAAIVLVVVLVVGGVVLVFIACLGMGTTFG